MQIELFQNPFLSTPWTGAVTLATGGAQQPAPVSTFQFVETSALLGISGTYTGTARRIDTVAAPSAASFFVADFYSDQAGTAFVEKSQDAGVTWTPCNGLAGTALAAGASLTIKVPVTCIRYRVRYVNGGVAQGVFAITSAYNFN